MRKPEVEDLVLYDGVEYRVTELLSSQFVVERLDIEAIHEFIFYRDAWRHK